MPVGGVEPPANDIPINLNIHMTTKQKHRHLHLSGLYRANALARKNNLTLPSRASLNILNILENNTLTGNET